MRKRLPIGSALLAAAHFFGSAATVFGQIGFESHVLDNGLQVILSEDHRAPTVSVAVVYDAGSRNESEGETGLAHLVEHMMFRGSANVGSGEHYVRVAEAGTPPGARTTRETASYVQTVTSNHLDLVLFLEADRMRSLEPASQSIAEEKARIRNERAAASDRPYGRVDDIVFEEAFDSFGYAHPTLGIPGDLTTIGVADVTAFHRAYYAPGNAVLSIVGDFEPVSALRSVRRYFGMVPSRPLPATMAFVEPPRSEEARTSVVDPVAAYPRIDIAYRVPAGNTPQWFRLALVAEILGGEGGRLRRLVETGRALDAVATLDEHRVGSLFRVSAVLAPEQNVDAALEAIDAELARLGSEPVPAVEIEGARARLERLNAEGLSTTAGVAESLALNTVYYGDPGVVNRSATVFAGITEEHLRSAAELYLVDRARIVVAAHPEGTEP